jgi:hypothetical protein
VIARRLAGLASLALAACAGIPANDPNLLVRGPIDAKTTFAGAATSLPGSLVSGFDPVRAEAGWVDGERALYEVVYERDGRTTRRYAEVQLRGPELPEVRRMSIRADGKDVEWVSGLRHVGVASFDENGERLSTSVTSVPTLGLLGGLAKVCAVAKKRRAGQDPPESATELANAVTALMSFTEIVAENETLAPIFWDVVAKPTLWSILTGFGVTVSVEIDAHGVRRVPAPVEVPGLFAPVYRMPVTIYGNGAPMLHAALWVTDTASPLRVAGGVLGVEGYRPQDPKTRFTIQLRSARRPAEAQDHQR